MFSLMQYKTVRDRILNPSPGEFFIYDVSTAQNIIIGNVDADTWASQAGRLTAGSSGRYQHTFMPTRNRAGFVNENGANDPFEYTDDRSASAWSAVNTGKGTVNALMYNPDADKLVGISNTGVGHVVLISNDGGATWDSSSDYGGAGALTKSYGAWGRNTGRYVFCDATANVVVQNVLYHATDPTSWTQVTGGMDGEFGGGFATIRYSSTYKKYMSTGAGGNVGYTKKFYSSSSGTSFGSVAISADNVPWFDSIEVGGVIITVAGYAMVTPTTSNLCARSTDGGATFNVAASMPATRRWSYMAYNGKCIACVAATEAKVAVTRDLGISWTEYNLPNVATGFRIGAFYPMPT